MLASGETWLGSRSGPTTRPTGWSSATSPRSGRRLRRTSRRGAGGRGLARVLSGSGRSSGRSGRGRPRAVRRPGRADAGPGHAGPVRFFPTTTTSSCRTRTAPGSSTSTRRGWPRPASSTRPSGADRSRSTGTSSAVGGWNGTRRRGGRQSSRSRSFSSAAARRDVEAEAIALAAFLAPELADRDVRFDERPSPS